MNMKIFKYEMGRTMPCHSIQVKGLDRVLSLKKQRNSIVLYCLINSEDTTTQQVNVMRLLTGIEFPLPHNAVFLDTLLFDGYQDPDSYVEHYFYNVGAPNG